MVRVFPRSKAVLSLAVIVLFGGPAAAQTDRMMEVDSFDYFTNNWNVIGLKDYNHGSRVTPDNELWLGGRTAVQVRYGRQLTPLGRQHGKRAASNWLPIMCVSAEDGPVVYEFRYWATPLPDAKDWQAAFGWPTEGENFLVWVTVKATNRSASCPSPGRRPAQSSHQIGTTSPRAVGTGKRGGTLSRLLLVLGA